MRFETRKHQHHPGSEPEMLLLVQSKRAAPSNKNCQIPSDLACSFPVLTAVSSACRMPDWVYEAPEGILPPMDVPQGPAFQHTRTDQGRQVWQVDLFEKMRLRCIQMQSLQSVASWCCAWKQDQQNPALRFHFSFAAWQRYPPPSLSYNVWCEHHLQETAFLKLTNTNRHTKISIIIIIIIIIISNFES